MRSIQSKKDLRQDGQDGQDGQDEEHRCPATARELIERVSRISFMSTKGMPQFCAIIPTQSYLPIPGPRSVAFRACRSRIPLLE